MTRRYDVVFLDMDEVLVDFTEGVCRLFGITVEELDSRHPQGEYDMCPALGVVGEGFWQRITAAGEGFWVGLNPTPWFNSIITQVEKISTEWHILSSPSRCPLSHSGKVKWLKSRFGASFSNFALTPHKHLFSKPGTLLIDDRAENCTRFEAHGGQAILFPSRWNSLHPWRHSPMGHVRVQGLMG